jgi:thiol-disulfide isomerase/thioredoxin
MSLKEQLAEYRAGWYQRVPAERQAIMQRHIDELRAGPVARTMLKVGDQAPPIVLKNAKGTTVDVGALIKKGPVIVTFYRGGWCPYCNLELKAYQEILPEIAAAGASLVAISPEKPDDTLSTVEKTRSGSRCSATSAKRSDVHSAWFTSSPKSSSRPTTASIWIFRPAMGRQANGRSRYLQLTLSTAMARSSTPTRMSTTETAPTPAMSCRC